MPVWLTLAATEPLSPVALSGKNKGTRAADIFWGRKCTRTVDGHRSTNWATLAELAGGPVSLDDNTICTEWDKFHRLDIALVRAIAATPMAEELYQLAATMDHMFHKGDGRLLLRAVAHRTGTTVKSGAMPGMTRQAVALTREPSNLVHKFRALTASS